MTADYQSIDAIVAALYATISGPAGPRRWSREQELFHRLARLMRSGVDERGRPWLKVMSLSEYIEDVTPFLAARDFYEVEIGRHVDHFGNIAQVRSVYEARTAPDGTEPLAAVDRRGVNLIQLYHDGVRWWVLSILWDNEREGVAVPAAWSGHPGDVNAG